MTIALWCVLVAALLPYLGTLSAKIGGRMPLSANGRPRDWLQTLDGWQQRANWYQYNSFEAFPPFAAGVIIAQMLHADQFKIDAAAIIFIACRVLHYIFYVADVPRARSTVWLGGVLCVVWLFLLGA